MKEDIVNTNEINEANVGDNIYTPTLIWANMKNVAPKLNQNLYVLSTIVGTLCRNNHNINKDYNGFFYHQIRDEQLAVTLKIPQNVMPMLVDKFEKKVQLQGVLQIQVYESKLKIEPIFVVSNFLKTVEAYQDLSSELQDLKKVYEKQRNRFIGSNQIEDTISKGYKVGIIIGDNAVIGQDILSALGEYKDKINLQFERTNLSQAQEILNKINELESDAKCGVICIARGGGSGLEIFNNYELVSQILDAKKPILSAIGHAQDVTLLEQVADAKFETPTAFGNYLKSIAYKISLEEKEKLSKTNQEYENKYKGKDPTLIWKILAFLFFVLMLLAIIFKI